MAASIGSRSVPVESRVRDGNRRAGESISRVPLQHGAPYRLIAPVSLLLGPAAPAGLAQRPMPLSSRRIISSSRKSASRHGRSNKPMRLRPGGASWKLGRIRLSPQTLDSSLGDEDAGLASLQGTHSAAWYSSRRQNKFAGVRRIPRLGPAVALARPASQVVPRKTSPVQRTCGPPAVSDFRTW